MKKRPHDLVTVVEGRIMVVFTAAGAYVAIAFLAAGDASNRRHEGEEMADFVDAYLADGTPIDLDPALVADYEPHRPINGTPPRDCLNGPKPYPAYPFFSKAS